MADISTVAQTYDNAGVAIAASATAFNKKARAGQGIAGSTHILSVDLNGGGNHTQATIDGFLNGIQHGEGLVTAGVSDAFTVVAVKGAVGDAAITVVVQGTGTPSTVAQEYFANVDIVSLTTIPGLQA
jgi:hypothetical protein